MLGAASLPPAVSAHAALHHLRSPCSLGRWQYYPLWLFNPRTLVDGPTVAAPNIRVPYHTHRPPYPNVKARGGPTALELQTTAVLARAAGRNVPYNTVRIPELLGYEG